MKGKSGLGRVEEKPNVWNGSLNRDRRGIVANDNYECNSVRLETLQEVKDYHMSGSPGRKQCKLCRVGTRQKGASEREKCLFDLILN